MIHPAATGPASPPPALQLHAFRWRMETWLYRVAPLLTFSLIDDPAMLALAFC